VSIFLKRDTQILVQGITGTGGQAHAGSMLAYGTSVVAGVSPGHGGETVVGLPVYETCHDAVRNHPIDMSVCFAGGKYILDAIYEAADAGVKTVVCIEEFVPLQDSLRAQRYCQARGCRLIGPNCNGMISPGQSKVGFFPEELSLPGPVGIASRSGTLTYGAMLALQRLGIGQSTVVGIGGARIKGTTFVDCLAEFAADDQTQKVLLLGEIGGVDEEDAARYLRSGYSKPVVAVIVGRSAPPDVPMGHAGAIVREGRGGWQDKVAALEQVGVTVVANLDEAAEVLAA
jgi:succinyl-CoA synthetase alpha subunit